MAERRKVRLMVASTVYGNEELLDQVFAILCGYGYRVWMSHKGTIPLSPKKTAFQNCLDAVDNCDVFFGIITGHYGSGKRGDEPSIIHQEISRAIHQNKPRYFAVHFHVTIARQLLKQFRCDDTGKPKPHNFFKPTAILDDIRVIDMYDEATRSGLPLEDRTGNWVQPYTTRQELLDFIETQFADPERILNLLSELKKGENQK